MSKLEDKKSWSFVQNNLNELFNIKLQNLIYIYKSKNQKIILNNDQKNRIYNIYKDDFINFNYNK